jgi:hypothetical protein
MMLGHFRLLMEIDDAELVASRKLGVAELTYALDRARRRV